MTFSEFRDMILAKARGAGGAAQPEHILREIIREMYLQHLAMIALGNEIKRLREALLG